MKKLFLFFLLMCSFFKPSIAQWYEQSSGLLAAQNPHIRFFAIDTSICWGLQDHITSPKCILTTDGGENWNILDIQGSSGLVGESIAAIDSKTAWITLDDQTGSVGNGGIYKTTDGGVTWVKQESAFSGAGAHPRSIYFFDSENGICTGNPRENYWEIYTTTNGGDLWSRVTSENIPVPDFGEVTGGGIKKGSGSSFWFNTSHKSVYRTTDKGKTWAVSRYIFDTGFWCEIAFLDSMNGIALSFFDIQTNRALRTTNGGVTWTSLPSPPEYPSTFFITAVPGSNGSYVISSHYNLGFIEPTYPGSVYTMDNGATWVQIDSLEHGQAAFANANVGWSAGPGGIIYKWDGSNPITSVQQITETVDYYHLEQNYPNPFNPATTISFSIPSPEFVSLKVYDILGNEVATLVDEEKNVGNYKIDFNGAELSSGIYMYKLTAGKYEQTKKLVLMK